MITRTQVGFELSGYWTTTRPRQVLVPASLAVLEAITVSSTMTVEPVRSLILRVGGLGDTVTRHEGADVIVQYVRAGLWGGYFLNHL